MGGLFLGSLLYPKFVSPSLHPLRVYALIEVAIGVIGLAVLVVVPMIGGVYTAWAGPGLAGLLLRGLAAALCLLPPTVLMGATLPALSRWVESTPRGVSWLGFFYASNTVGAVLGCLLAGFYLLRVHDMPTATYVAVGLNLTVAAVSLALASFAAHRPADTAAVDAKPAPGASAIYIATALSGMTGLAAEVVWTRLLSLLIGGTTYTFSLILAAFLVGHRDRQRGGRRHRPDARQRARVALGWCQALLCGRDRLGGLFAVRVAALLADRPVALREPLVQLPARLRPLPVGDPAGHAPLGRQLPARAGGARHARAATRRGWSAASTPPTPSARSSDRWPPASSSSSALGSQHTQQLLILLCGVSALVVLEPVAGAVTGARRPWLRFAVVVLRRSWPRAER